MVGLKQLERDGNVMTKRVINIKLEENGNVKLENGEDNNIIVFVDNTSYPCYNFKKEELI